MKILSPEEIRDQLTRILESKEFVAAKRHRQFLRYVVEQSLNGESDRIKQYTIAVEALGFGENFDPQSNSMVRIQGRRLRQALDQYYNEQGIEDPILIKIPKGTYVPRFVENKTTRSRARSKSSNGQFISPQKTVERSSLKKPISIAVLPFVFQDDNHKDAYIADALTEALTVGLAKFESLGVIASQFTQPLKNAVVPVDTMAKILGVRFVLTGSVRKQGDALRVAVQLTDTHDGVLLWAESMDRDTSSPGIFATLDDITRRILINVGDEHGFILNQLIPEIQNKPTNDLSFYEASLLYHHYNTTVGREKNKLISRVLERAVENNPEYALGWGQLAAVYGDVYTLNYQGLDNPLEKALFCAKKAIALDSRSQESRANLALIRLLLRQHKAAIAEAKKAIPLNSSSAYVVSFSGWIIGLSGELEQGRRIIDEMDEFKPNTPGWLRLVAFLYHMQKGEYDHALHEARRFRMPDELAWDPICRAAAAGHLGKAKIAAAAYDELVKKFPAVAGNIEEAVRIYIHFDPWINSLLDGLWKAKVACGILSEPEQLLIKS